jgi:hypothetical protein
MNGFRYAARKVWLAALIRDAIATAEWFDDWDSHMRISQSDQQQFFHQRSQPQWSLMHTKTTVNATSSNLTNCSVHFLSWRRRY